MRDNLKKALSISDLRSMARARLPRILFELIESGVEDEHSLERNTSAFRRFSLLPRYLTEIQTRVQTTTLLGNAYSSPFGIGPTGFAGLLRHRGDYLLAQAANASNVPFIVSGASAGRIEDLAQHGPKNVWYHIYPAKNPEISWAILERVGAAGLDTLVITVDNPVYPKRERDIRNGFSLPLRLSLGTMLEALRHPGWLYDYLRYGGMPLMDTWVPHAPPGANSGEVAAFFRSQSPSIQTWHSIAQFRSRWPGRLVLKGIQHPQDAVRALEEGVDAIIVSNHGGKSFDLLPSPIDTLPAVKAAVGHAIPVMFDSGIRRGSDIVTALCLGADFCFVGRATLYGVVAAGRDGVEHALKILREEIDMTLAMIGCANIADLGSHYLHANGTTLPPLKIDNPTPNDKRQGGLL